MDLKDKRVTVVGLARSGVGAANLLAAMGARVTVTDMKPEAALQEAVGQLSPAVQRSLGGHPDELFSSTDMLVLSPGVPEIRQIAAARAKAVPVIGELELAWQMLQKAASGKRQAAGQEKLPFIAITGSNGKSTTTTLVDLMLRRHGITTVLGGNIGSALSEELMKLLQSGSGMPDAVVVEVSSFQLESIDTFRPHISAILNITPDHMDRYTSPEAYSRAKARIYLNQSSGDYLVLNADDPETMRLHDSEPQLSKGNGPVVVFFSRRKQVSGVYAKDGMVYTTLQTGTALPLIAVEDIALHGVHNLENAMAASAMALLAGCAPGPVIDVLKTFAGLEHRLEFVRELAGVRYINDSKGTNVDAVLKSLEGFSQPVVLIAGGRDKSGDFTVLREIVQQKVKSVILIGEAAEKIGKALGNTVPLISAASLADAVLRASRLAESGDVVLLSPACTSFDMFRDFEDRGRQFKQLVLELKA
ncbi:MAG: UDP-N-acetylmuramoyl-L-alanine--D-glutamate ligase [Thermodesulfovibrio sp.]|nr:UDP-N-acetylmuramoyl-L-alanine--D-glutamate ligase [Thermodesulfovibrio sp.]